MAELSLMASAALSPGIFHHDPHHSLLRSPPTPPPKEFQLPSHGRKQNILSSGGMQMGMSHLDDRWKFPSLSSDNQLFKAPSVVTKPMLIDVQDSTPDSVLFSYGIAEQCTRHQKILKFLTSGSNITDENELDISLISDLLGFQSVAVDICPQIDDSVDDELCLYKIGTNASQKIVHPSKQLYAPPPVLDFIENLSHNSSIAVHPNGNILFTGSTAEMKDLFSIFAEFDLSKNAPESRKAMVVPYFTRRRGGHARAYTQVPSMFETQTVVPSKSSEKSKTQQKKKQNTRPSTRPSSESHKSYFYACDCLVNMYLDKSGSRATILSLKDSGPELTQLLSHFSAGVVGTGLAVLLSFACKAMNGRAVFLSSLKLFNVAFGFGLFWFARAVSRLQATICHVSKRSARGKKQNEEAVLVEEVKSSMNEILFRFVALMAVGVLSIL